MRFEKLENIGKIYGTFIADSENYNFENTEQAIKDFENFLLSTDIQSSIAQEIRARALHLGCVFEQQGFFHGMAKGINFKSEIELVERK